MGVPVHYNTQFTYREHVAVVDVQTIIDDLYTDLVTTGGWTCTVGGVGVTPTTYKTPTRSDGAFFTITLTRISATRLSFIMYDNIGLLVNNQTDTRLDIAASPGNSVQTYAGPFHLVVNSARATPECFMCGIADQTPEPLATPRPIFFASAGPRNNAGTLTMQTWGNLFMLLPGTAAYAVQSAAYSCCMARAPQQGTQYILATLSGTYVAWPAEFYFPGTMSVSGWWAGRICQCVMVDSSLLTFGSEINVPLDGTTTGVFKVVGLTAYSYILLAFRKATL